MELDFIDRTLTCSDCRTEFIFTAGEQLFFHEKQFRNDPKRCKGCKSRRAGATGGATGAATAGPLRTETRTQCSECEVETTVPFKPTQGRPVLCRQCFQKRLRAIPPIPVPVPAGAGIDAGSGLAQTVDAVAMLPLISGQVAPMPEPSVDVVNALTHLIGGAAGEGRSGETATLALASMVAAGEGSSVATLKDLESLVAVHPADAEGDVYPLELLQQEFEDAELAELMAQTADA